MLSPTQTLLVIFGADNWPRLDLKGSEHFSNSARAFKTYFTDVLGVVELNVLDLFNSDLEGSRQVVACGLWLRQRITETAETSNPITDIIIFYTGHGDYLETKNEFYMPVAGTMAGLEMQTALRIEELATALHKCARFHRKFLFLDCCYAGAAAPYFMGAEASMPVNQFRQIAKEIPIRGTALLCAASGDRVAMMSESGYTMFTQAFCEILLEGSSEAGYQFTLYELRDLIWQRIKQREGDRAPRPVLHVPDQTEGDIAQVGLFVNPYARTFIPGIPPASAIDPISNKHAISLTDERRLADTHRNIREQTERIRRFAALLAIGSICASFTLVMAVSRIWPKWLEIPAVLTFVVLSVLSFKNPKSKPNRPTIVPFVIAVMTCLLAGAVMGVLDYTLAFLPILAYVATNVEGSPTKRVIYILTSYVMILIGVLESILRVALKVPEYFPGGKSLFLQSTNDTYGIGSTLTLTQPLFIVYSAFILYGVSVSPMPRRIGVLLDWLRDNFGLNYDSTAPRYTGNMQVAKNSLLAWLLSSLATSLYVNTSVTSVGIIRYYSFPMIILGVQAGFWIMCILNSAHIPSRILSYLLASCALITFVSYVSRAGH